MKLTVFHKLILAHRKKFNLFYFIFLLKSTFREKVTCIKTILGSSLYIKRKVYYRIWETQKKLSYFHLIVFLGFEAEK